MLLKIKGENADLDRHCGVALTGHRNLTSFESSRQTLLANLRESLANRFDGDEIIDASHIMSTQTWPKDLQGILT